MNSLSDAGFDPYDMESTGLRTGVFFSGGSLPHIPPAVFARSIDNSNTASNSTSAFDEPSHSKLDPLCVMRAEEPAAYFAAEIGFDKVRCVLNGFALLRLMLPTSWCHHVIVISLGLFSHSCCACFGLERTS